MIFLKFCDFRWTRYLKIPIVVRCLVVFSAFSDKGISFLKIKLHLPQILLTQLKQALKTTFTIFRAFSAVNFSNNSTSLSFLSSQRIPSVIRLNCRHMCVQDACFNVELEFNTKSERMTNKPPSFKSTQID